MPRLARLAGKLGVTVDGEPPQTCAARALQRLAESRQRWLLVLDNVQDPEQLANCHPHSGDGRVLVTSRRHDVTPFGPRIVLRGLDPAAATDYLLEHAPRCGTRAAARRLAADLGFLPLALSHAAAYCAKADRHFETYRKRLDRLPTKQLFRDRPEPSYKDTVASTWRVSIAEACHRDALAGAVLELAAHLGPDAIPRYLFAGLIDPGGDHLLDAALQVLVDFSLAELTKDAVIVHRLVQKVVRDAAEVTGARNAAFAALPELATRFPHAASPADWPVCEELLLHVLSLGRYLWPATPDDAEMLVDLQTRASDYLLQIGRRRDAVDVAEHATDLTGTPHLPEAHPVALAARIRYVDALQWASESETALDLAEKVHHDCEQRLGPDHELSVMARAQLMISYQWAGRTNDVLELGPRVVEDLTRILGEEHRGTLMARVRLAWSYAEAGLYAEAIAIQRKLLEVQIDKLEADHLDTLISRGSLARTLRLAGQLAEATGQLEITLQGREHQLRPEHPDVLWTRANLGKCHELAGGVADAIAAQEAVVPMCSDVLGAEHHDTLMYRSYLASAYQAGAQLEQPIGPGLDEAIRLIDEVARHRDRLHPHHPDSIDARAQQARAYYARGRVQDAIAKLERAVEDGARIRGHDHPITLAMGATLAQWVPGP